MNDAIDITTAQRKTVLDLLSRHLPDTEVWVYGSRANWTSKPHSDLDMVVFTTPDQSSKVADLKEAFEESDLPFRVDLFVWDEIPDSFKRNIEAEHVVLRNKPKKRQVPPGWAYRKVAEIAEVIGGGTPKTKKDEFWGGDIPWLTPKDLSGEHPRYVSHGERNITKTGLASSSARIVPPKTVLLTSRAPVGYVAMAKNPITTNQGFRSLVVNDENDPEFVYYLLLNNTEYLKQHASGSTFQELSGGTLKSLEFLMPPLPEQKAIAHILGTLDDKIELNRRMNETLEGLARTIFKSWFIDFDPVRAKAEGRDTGLPKEIKGLFPDGFEDSELGEIPKGWSVKQLSELTELITKGTTPRQEDIGNAPHTDVQINFVRVNCIEEDGSLLADKLTNIPESVHTGCLKRSILKHNDLLYTIAGTIGRLTLTEDWILPANTNQAIAIIRPNPTIPPGFLLLTMRQEAFMQELHSNIVHAVQANLSLGMLSKAKVVVPPLATLPRLYAAISVIQSRVFDNRAQNRSLVALRDTLMPTFLSGRLAVPDLQQKLGRAL